MIHENKYKALIHWINCFPLEEKIEDLKQLSDGSHFIKLLETKDHFFSLEEGIGPTSRFKALQQFLNGEYSPVLVEDTMSCLLGGSQGDQGEDPDGNLDWEAKRLALSKVALLTMTALLRPKRDDLSKSTALPDDVMSSLMLLDESTQLEIFDCLETILDPPECTESSTPPASPNLDELLARTKSFLKPAFPSKALLETPKGRKWNVERKLGANRLPQDGHQAAMSPIKAFLDSPQLICKVALREHEKELASLRLRLNEEVTRGLDLDTDLSKATFSIQQKEKEIQDLKKYLQELKQKLEEMNSKEFDEDEQSCQECARTEERLRELEEYKSENLFLSSELENLTSRLEELQNDGKVGGAEQIHILQDKVSDLEKKLELARWQNEQLNDQKSGLQSQLESSRRELENLLQFYSEKKADLPPPSSPAATSQPYEILDQSLKISELESENKKLEANLRKEMSRVHSLEASLLEMEVKHQDELAQKENCISQLSKRENELLAEVNKVESSLESLSKELEESQNHHVSAQNEILNLHNLIELYQLEKRELEAEYNEVLCQANEEKAALKDAAEQAKIEFESLSIKTNEKIAKLQSTLALAESSLKEKETTFEKQGEELRTAHKLNYLFEEELSSLILDLEGLTEKCTKLEKSKTSIDSQFQDLQGKLLRIETSIVEKDTLVEKNYLQLEKIQKHSEVCFSEMQENLGRLKEQLVRDVTQKEDNISYLKSREAQLMGLLEMNENKIADILNQLESAQIALKNTEEQKAQYQLLSQQLENEKSKLDANYREIAVNLENMKSEADSLQKINFLNAELLSKKEEQIGELQSSMASLAEVLKNKNEELEKKEAKIGEISNNNCILQKDILEFKAMLDQRSSTIAELADATNSARTKIEHLGAELTKSNALILDKNSELIAKDVEIENTKRDLQLTIEKMQATISEMEGKHLDELAQKENCISQLSKHEKELLAEVIKVESSRESISKELEESHNLYVSAQNEILNLHNLIEQHQMEKRELEAEYNKVLCQANEEKVALKDAIEQAKLELEGLSTKANEQITKLQSNLAASEHSLKEREAILKKQEEVLRAAQKLNSLHEEELSSLTLNLEDLAGKSTLVENFKISLGSQFQDLQAKMLGVEMTIEEKGNLIKENSMELERMQKDSEVCFSQLHDNLAQLEEQHVKDVTQKEENISYLKSRETQHLGLLEMNENKITDILNQLESAQIALKNIEIEKAEYQLLSQQLQMEKRKLDSDYSEIKINLENMKSDADSLQKVNLQNEELLSMKEEQIGDLQASMASLAEVLKNKNEELEKKETKIREITNNNCILQKDISEFKAMLEQSSSTIEELNDANSSTRTRNEHLEAELAKANSLILDKDTALNTKDVEIEIVKKDLESTIKKLQKNLDEKDEYFFQKLAERDCFASEILERKDELESKLENVQSEINDLSSQLKDSRDELSNSQYEVAQSKCAIEKMKEEIERLKYSHEESLTNIEHLNAIKIKSVEQDNKRLGAMLAEAEGQIKVLKTSLTLLEETLRNKTEVIDEKEQELNRTQNAKLSLQEELVALQAQLESSITEFNEQIEKNRDLHSKMGTMESILFDKEEIISKSTQEIEEIKKDTTYSLNEMEAKLVKMEEEFCESLAQKESQILLLNNQYNELQQELADKACQTSELCKQVEELKLTQKESQSKMEALKMEKEQLTLHLNKVKLSHEVALSEVQKENVFHLGEAQKTKLELEAKVDQIEKLHSLISTMDTIIEEKALELAESQGSKVSLEETIARLRSELVEQTSTCKNLDSDKALLQSRLEDTETTLSTMEASLKDSLQKIKSMEDLKSELDKIEMELSKERSWRETEGEPAIAKVITLKREVDLLNEEVSSLKLANEALLQQARASTKDNSKLSKIDKQHKEEVARLKAKLKEREMEAIGTIRELQIQMDAKMDKLQKGMVEKSQLEGEKAALQAKYEKAKKYIAQMAFDKEKSIKANQETVASEALVMNLEQELQRIHKDLESEKQASAKLRRQLEEMSHRYEVAQAKTTEAERLLQKLSQEKRSLESQLAFSDSQIRELRGKLDPSDTSEKSKRRHTITRPPPLFTLAHQNDDENFNIKKEDVPLNSSVLSSLSNPTISDFTFYSGISSKEAKPEVGLLDVSSFNATINSSRNIPAGIGSRFQCEDEEGEFMDPRHLVGLKSGELSTTLLTPNERRFTELHRRNTLCLPHLKSSYPAEMQIHAKFDQNNAPLSSNAESTRVLRELNQKSQPTSKPKSGMSRPSVTPTKRKLTINSSKDNLISLKMSKPKEQPPLPRYQTRSSTASLKQPPPETAKTPTRSSTKHTFKTPSSLKRLFNRRK